MEKIELNHIIFQKVKEAATSLGLDTYVVGGYVRDQLIGRKSKDIDFVCVGSGIELARKVASLLSPNLKVNFFKTYGTAQFVWEGWELEFVGARKESYRKDSRNPLIEEGSLTDDQNRRDFTINALAASVNIDDFGEIIDPFNGIEDLKNGIIQTPLNPDITFSDDPLRMMRAIRFASQLNFTIAEPTLKAIERNKERIEIITQERITTELNKIVLAKKPSIGFLLLDQTGLLPYIFEELSELKGVDYFKNQGHKDNFYHTLQVLDNLCKNTDHLWLRWSAILHDIGKPKSKRFEEGNGWTFHGHEVIGERMTQNIFRKLKLPLNQEMKYVQKLVRLHLRPIPIARDGISDSAIRRLLFDAGDDIDDLMMLCEADITSKNESKVKRILANFQIVRTKLKEIEEKDHIRNFEPPISGELIMQAFDLKPCKEIGIIKNQIKDAILDGEIPNELNAAQELMFRLGEKMGLKKVV
ncbi:CCA tRNA nucleotidyltransferase [Chitinophagales bacterium]|nr:CCA tRNA nucleotidyltransferase [Chitinophagales bacterium]